MYYLVIGNIKIGMSFGMGYEIDTLARPENKRAKIVALYGEKYPQGPTILAFKQ